MLPAPLGVDYLGERAEWDAACHARKDCCRPPYATDDSTGQSNSRKPLGAHRETARGLDMACADLEWARRAVQPQETAQKSSATGWCPSVCVVQSPPHIPDASRRVGV